MTPVTPDVFGMWATFAIIVGALALYMIDRIPVVLKSLIILCALLGFFHVVPVGGPLGAERIGAEALLAGFANPALIAIVALMILGEGLARTGILTSGAGHLLRFGRGRPTLAFMLAMAAVLLVSGFLNNTPVVVIFIPILQGLAERVAHSPSKLLMPLSYAAILGGMPTLIGSSTNLLVVGALVELGQPGLSFFQFFVPGAIVALVGFAYVILVAPRLLPERAPLMTEVAGHGRQFIAEISVAPGSKFDGLRAKAGLFPELQTLVVRVIIRQGEAFFPPYDDFELTAGDIIVVAATRQALADALKGDPEHFHPELGPDWEEFVDHGQPRWRIGKQMLAEAMITPTSRFVGQTLSQIGFRYYYHCVALGVQRRSEMLRARVTEIRLEAGDVVLFQGRPDDIANLRGDPNILLIEWSAQDIPAVHHARSALAIFGAVVLAAASGLVPIATAALIGVALMLTTGVLTLAQAGRAIDKDIIVTIAAALALGVALQATGGADFLARHLLGAVGGVQPAAVLSAFFLLVMLLSNVITAKTTAVLFTPIAIGLATGLGVSVEPFAVAVILAANCSFASPIGYQTNLLVMAPGNYRFVDFVRAGLPLLVVVWIAFSLVGPWYYDLPW